MSKAVANLTQSTETITFSAQDNGETISVNITEAARGPAGADGPAGPNSVTSATTSDGTANLSLSNVTTATAEVTGTLTANHIHGNLAGSVYAHVRAGENLAKGDPVYVSGSHGTGANLIAIVSKADASDGTKMPAVGIMDAAVLANANGHMVITGTITDIDTAAYLVNAELYVASGGGLTATPPSARAQPVARVERSNLNNGAVIVKVNGLSAVSQTANTLVRRSSTGASSFNSVNIGGTGNGSGSISLDPIPGIVDGMLLLGSPQLLLQGGAQQAIIGPSGFNLASGTITTSQPLSLTQTWNASGVTFKGIDVNVTDTASASGSLLMDLRVGGNPYFSIEKNGSTRLYRTYSTSTNFERLNLKYTGTAFQIGTEKGSGGGTARPLEFQTDGTTRMLITAGGNVSVGTTSNTEEFNVKGTVRVESKTGSDNIFLQGYNSSGSLVGQMSEASTNGSGGLLFVGNRIATGGNGVFFQGYTTSTGNAAIEFRGYGGTNASPSALTTTPIAKFSKWDGANIVDAVTVDVNGRLGVGTTSPASKITATGGDIEVTDSASGIILKSPDGTRYRIQVANGGTLTVTAV